LLNSLLADYKQPENPIGEIGLLKQLTKLLVKKALKGEFVCLRLGGFKSEVQRVDDDA